MMECWRRLRVDFAWFSKVLNLLKVVHMISEMVYDEDRIRLGG